MPRILIVTNHAFVIESKNMVEILAHSSLDETTKLRNSGSSIQMALA
jgi:phosphotransferase system IIA component